MFTASKNTNRTNRKLTFQTLESRQLMAGNVAVSVVGGDLRITGDDSANDIAVFQTMQQGHVIPGSYYVSGLNGTTINGNQGGFYFTGVNRDFNINMGQGDDHLAMGFVSGFDPSLSNANFIVPRNLSVTMGNGNNNLEVKGITVGNNTSILAGSGNNTMDVRGNFGTANGIIRANPLLPIIPSRLPHGNLTIQAGGGDDQLEVHNGRVYNDLNIKLGGGQSRLDTTDLVAMNVRQNLNIHSGGGRDMNLVSVQGVHVGHDLNIEGGIAKDIVSIGNTTVADRLFATLGHGDDFLSVEGVTAATAVLDGNVDVDTFHAESNHFTTQPQILSFEHVA
jgi:hypothetical protein